MKYLTINVLNEHYNVVYDEEGVIYISNPFESVLETLSNFKNDVEKTNLDKYNVQKELTEYYQGIRKEFSFPIKLIGTTFQVSVWEKLLDIPYGKTVSYQDIAVKINNIKGVRAVGGAIGKNPLLIRVPCHRVIGKDGSLTGFGGGIPLKIKLLDLEKNNL